MPRFVVLSFILLSFMTGCFQKKSIDESEVKSHGSHYKPMLGVENINPNYFFCVTKRADDRAPEGKYYAGSGKTRIEACQQSQEICGAVTGFGDGTGACVIVVSFDDLITGFGQVDVGPGATTGFACLAKEMPFAGDGFSQRSWPGVGPTIKAAYDAAISLCQYRGGVNCQAWDRCIDLSNASFNSY